MPINPLKTLRTSKHLIPSHSPFPNCSLSQKPLLIYHSAFPLPSASSVESHLRHTGVVQPQWRYTMYREHHYHSTTHEVLVVYQGRAKVCFGGLSNPKRVEMQVEKGDVIIIPAGVAHALLNDVGESDHSLSVGEKGGRKEEGFMMIGSYPPGKQWDHCTTDLGKEGEERIKNLGWFEKDPIYGNAGPVLD
jgi:uncharacterized protein YjlB